MKTKPGNEDLLILYSIYKQATDGDCSGEAPGMFDMVGAAKYNARKELAGMDKEEAMRKYIAKVEELKAQDD